MPYSMDRTWCTIFLTLSYINYISRTIAVKQTIFVKEGLTVDFSCPFQAVTKPIIWRGPPNLTHYSIGSNINEQIDNLGKINVNGNLTTQKYNLSVSNFTTTDAGLYRCETIINKTSKRHEIEVHLAVSPVVRVYVEPSPVVEEGHNFTLTCLYDSNTNESFMRWKLNDRLLMDTQSRNLHVANVYKEDAGQYCCEVVNQIGIGTDKINITVLYKPRVIGHSNTLEIESNFEKPSFISFTIASGTKPNISWTILRGGKIGYWNVQDIGEEIFNVSSTIFPLEKSHLGQYSVRVRNKIGGIDLNIELEGFKVNVFPSKLICNVTNVIELTCNVSQYITSNLSNIWIHSYDGTEIRSLQGSIEKRSSKLQIPSCDYRDAGTYRCIWKSSTIVQSCSSTIHVQSHPVLTSVQTLIHNGKTTIKVRFVSFPPPLEVLWFYKDTIVSKPILSVGKSLQKTGVKIQIKTNMILVNGYVTSYQVKETKSPASAVEHYSCKVRNIIGNLDVSFPELNITRKEGLQNNTSKTGVDGIIHWSIYVLSGVFFTVVVMIITISVVSDRELLQKFDVKFLPRRNFTAAGLFPEGIINLVALCMMNTKYTKNKPAGTSPGLPRSAFAARNTVAFDLCVPRNILRDTPDLTYVQPEDAKQGGENAIRSEQDIGSRNSRQSATCHSYEDVDYHAIEWRNYNSEASLPVNNALTVRIDASLECRDSEKTSDCAYQSENDVVTNSYLELL